MTDNTEQRAAVAREVLIKHADELTAECLRNGENVSVTSNVVHRAMLAFADAILAAQPAPVSEGEEVRDMAAEQLRDDIIDLISPLHWEAWKAGVFTSQEEWPDDEEQEYLASCVDGVAVGEHFQAWGDEVADKLAALLSTPLPTDPIPDIVAWLRRQSDLGANRGNEADKGTTRRAAFGGGSLALARAADAIESGDYRTNDNALPADPVACADVNRLYWLKWIAAARPPVHMEPMTGQQPFSTIERAVTFMRNQPKDATFASLTETIEHRIDRSAEALAALSPSSPEGGERWTASIAMAPASFLIGSSSNASAVRKQS